MQEWVQVLGSFVTIAGLVVVAPYEAGRTLPDLGHGVVTVLNRLRGWLARWLPFLRKNASVNAGSSE